MSDHLRILALQSTAKIAEELGLEASLPRFFNLYGRPPEAFNEALLKTWRFLEELIDERTVSWWDVYSKSDIGKERLMLAEALGISKEDEVLDVGCGRGYFTIAAAKLASFVVGADLMNGLGRYGWWAHFNEAMRKLGLSAKVQGVRADAARIPLKSSSFDVVAAVHSIRNFKSLEEVAITVREMRRVVKPSGFVALVENAPCAKSRAQEVHLKLHEARVKALRDELRYFSVEELLELVSEAGFRDAEVEILDCELCATPQILYLPEKLRGNLNPQTVREYEEAVEEARRIGELSTPVIVVKAKK